MISIFLVFILILDLPQAPFVAVLLRIRMRPEFLQCDECGFKAEDKCEAIREKSHSLSIRVAISSIWRETLQLMFMTNLVIPIPNDNLMTILMDLRQSLIGGDCD